MSINKEQPQQDPVEGAPGVIERELERNDNKGGEDKKPGSREGANKSASAS
jgi:hypothetical protein